MTKIKVKGNFEGLEISSL